MHKYIVTVFLWLLCYSLKTQEDIRVFKQFTSEDGLPAMELYDVVQDSTGFIWLATSTGLCKFDGYQFHNFTTKNGLPQNDIIEIDYIDNTLWISSLGPLTYLQNDSFYQVPVKPNNLTGHIEYEVVRTPQEYYWISVFSDLFFLSPELELLPVPDHIKEDYIRFWVFSGADGNTWIYRSNLDEQNIIIVEEDRIIENISLPQRCEQARFISPDFLNNILFFHCGQTIYSYNPKTQEVNHELESDALPSDILTHNDELWVVYPRDGIIVYKISNEGKLKKHKHILKNSYPSAIHFDNEGNLWVTTLGSGLYFLPAQADKVSVISSDNRLDEPALESVLLYDSAIWVGNRGGEIYKYSLEKKLLHKYQLIKTTDFGAITNRIISMLPLSKDTILIGADRGLFLLTGNITTKLSADVTKHISQTPGDSAICISTNHAVFITDKEEIFKIYHDILKNGKSNYQLKPAALGRSYSSYRTNLDELWVGDALYGLVKYKDGKKDELSKRLQALKALPKDIDLFQDSILVVATHGEGVIFISPKQFFQLDESKRLASNFCSSLYIEKETIWVGTNKGLSKIENLDLKNLSAEISNFRKSDGLITDDIQDLCIWGDEVFLATQIGLNYFSDEELSSTLIAPNIVITKVTINEKQQSLKNYYHLKNDQNSIHIQYVGLNYRHRNNIRYAYKLEGLDTEWKYTQMLETRYSNLAPGKYTFILKAINDHGLEQEISAPINFEIDPHFTQTIWFPILISSFITFLTGLGIYTWTARNKNRWLQEEVTQKTKELNTKIEDLAEANTKLARSNEELKQFAHVASHDLKSPLRNISSFVQLLKRRAKDKLDKSETEFIDYAVQGARNMERLIDDLLNFSQVRQNSLDREWVDTTDIIEDIKESLKAEINSQNVNINVLNPMPVLRISRLNIQRLFQNLISNAIKFNSSDNPIINIACKVDDKYWLFAVEDNGIGIDEAYQTKIFQIFQRLHTPAEFPGTGVGLAICKKIVEENEGEIWLESKRGKGSVFFFTIPK
ncbi:MAG: ATP-binding protein [Chitinophagales bacterium]|nr:ATP-binding protein [Chitinophagales bacterium]